MKFSCSRRSVEVRTRPCLCHYVTYFSSRICLFIPTRDASTIKEWPINNVSQEEETLRHGQADRNNLPSNELQAIR